MNHQSDLYRILKGKVYDYACLISGRVNIQGELNVFELIMRDSNKIIQPMFTLGLEGILSLKQRMILLDGLAEEFQGCDGWLAYCKREENK